MSQNYWKSGSWNAVCAVCGFQYKSDELRKRWDGVYVCDKDWEPRHVLDFFKVDEKNPSAAWVQKETNTLTATIDSGDADPTTHTQATLEDDDYRIIISRTANITINLPVIATIPAHVARVQIARIDSSAATVTLVAGSGDSILGTATVAAGDYFELLINHPNQWKRS